MASLNKKTKTPAVRTHGGNIASRITPSQELERIVLAHMLWEDSFYVDGKTIANQIVELVPKVAAEDCVYIARVARDNMHLRHVPLLIAREMLNYNTHKKFVSGLLPEIIQRPDELTEFLAIYWKDGRCPIAAQAKKGLAVAFTKFDEYQLDKYNTNTDIKLRDVLFLVHPKPFNKIQQDIWNRLANNALSPQNRTWEKRLSAGESKQTAFTELMEKNQLGGMAFLRNLRNMEEGGVNKKLIADYATKANFSKVLPFRFIAAAKESPRYSDIIEKAMFRRLSQLLKLPGKTIFIVDESGSMWGRPVSTKSTMKRADAARALAAIAREVCEESVIYATAGNDGIRISKTELIPTSYRGFALVDWLSQVHIRIGGGGIFLKQVCDYIGSRENRKADRIIIITDEQDCDRGNENHPSKADNFGRYNYIINVGTYTQGIAYDKWVHINGWSEAVLDYIRLYEGMMQ